MSILRNERYVLWRDPHLLRASVSQIRIVLVEPEGADNVGAVSRVMRNFNFSKLVLVNPKCGYMEGRARAMHGIEVLTNCKVVMSLAEALNGCTRVIASTSRQRDSCTDLVLEGPGNVVPWLTQLECGSTAAVVFGRESSGLTNDELKLAHRFLKIPASEDYPVLNLAMAVGIVCYELYLWNNETASRNLNLQTTKATSFV
ncbi:tRNA/rRNA methyltransferase [Galdieria sulphuraria]|uniref:tRNA/rRNA methyltransferase n=1 Tax=Galdieria sulphuraria TaxID=130081 RepID=M2Y5Z9_GALSU|nr:tRNA/rRNA methyltransferase [Galdieria sulphuraria]EME31279.1 tRNA/rRNA methyltransferase [Galdieria sulphuraria]|eukprot:XP_005707799.1 tRNA/rRNA methyltransferase [Galdieria sulphuraria]